MGFFAGFRLTMKLIWGPRSHGSLQRDCLISSNKVQSIGGNGILEGTSLMRAKTDTLSLHPAHLHQIQGLSIPFFWKDFPAFFDSERTNLYPSTPSQKKGKNTQGTAML
jgi:hypothetical protein